MEPDDPGLTFREYYLAKSVSLGFALKYTLAS